MKQTLRPTLLLIFVCIFFGFSNRLQAQEYPGNGYGFRLGLTAHPTVGWIKPENGKGNGVNLGFSYGLMADFNFAENYSLATGLTVTTINGKSTEFNLAQYLAAVSTSGPVAFDLKYKLQYIEVPLTLKLKTEKIGELRWYGQFGISNDFNIGAKQDVQLGSTSFGKNIDVKKEINFYRAGLVLGAGLEYDIARSTSVTTGLTYNNGLTDISDDKNRNVKNHYVSINFGVFF